MSSFGPLLLASRDTKSRTIVAVIALVVAIGSERLITYADSTVSYEQWGTSTEYEELERTAERNAAGLLGAVQKGDPQEMANANDQLTGALGRLMVVAEAYPQLKSDQNFLRLQDELVGTENRVATAWNWRFGLTAIKGLGEGAIRAIIDVRDFSPNEHFLSEMERCIKESRFVLCVITPRYVESDHTSEEQGKQNEHDTPDQIDQNFPELRDLRSIIHDSKLQNNGLIRFKKGC